MSAKPQEMIRPRVLLAVRMLQGNEGITTQLQMLVEGLLERGWEVALISAIPKEVRKKAKRLAWFEEQGLKHFFAPFPRNPYHPSGLLDALRSVQKVNSAIKSFRPHLIHSYSLSLAPYLYLMRRRHRLPYISSCRIEIAQRGDKARFSMGSSMNRLLPGFLGDRAIAISSEIKREFTELLNMPEKHVYFIPNGVRQNHFFPPSAADRQNARDHLGLASDDRVVCIIGRLNPIKGHDLLAKAIARLRSDGMEVTALVAGTGDWEADIRRSIASQGVEDLVRLLGFTDAREVLWASDILVLPSMREGCANVVSEAMFCGVVPVRTPTAGAYDQVDDGVSGFVVPFNDPGAIANRLRQLFEDDRIRRGMSAAAIERARQLFTSNKMVADTVAVYNELLENTLARTPAGQNMKSTQMSTPDLV